MSANIRLLADIGATNTRFALLGADGAIGHSKTLQSGEADTLTGAIAAYLAPIPADSRPSGGAIAVAAPITGDFVAMTNGPWSFSIAATKRDLGWSDFFVINDFEANARAVPALPSDMLVQIGEGTPVRGAPVAVLGPGTGLGVSALIPSDGRWLPIASEGGHVSLAPADSREGAIIDILRRQFAHVSAERVLSGPGLVNLYDSLCELAGKPAGPLTPDHVTDLYPGCDPQCREAVTMFCAMLGSFAGDLALTLGARGGVYVMGGIAPKILEILRSSHFRARFEFKGRYRAYLAAVPTTIVIHPFPAFLGLKTLFD